MPVFRSALLFLALMTSIRVAAVDPQLLWFLPGVPESPAEQALLASVQGVLNQDGARVWVEARGLYPLLLEELRRDGIPIRKASNVWEVLAAERGAFAGFAVCTVTNDSLNRATTVSGVDRLVVVDDSLQDRVRELGLQPRADVRAPSPVEDARVNRATHRSIGVHQPATKAMHLRDFAISRRARTWFDIDPAACTAVVRQLDPGSRIFGWGADELTFVGAVSAGGGVVIPADWALNLSALQHLPAAIPARPQDTPPAPLREGERVVAFVVSDGDNIQWLLNGMGTSPGFWASPERGRFPVSWEMAPLLAEFAPRAMAHYARTATPLDDFVAGPSGVGYCFPSDSPDRDRIARDTSRALGPAGLRLVCVIDTGKDLSSADALAGQPGVDGVLFKHYSPYHRFAGAVRWHAGKPIVSFRNLLWEQRDRTGRLKPDLLPEGVARAVAALPSTADSGTGRFALVNVHAWSFRDSGGPMGAIARTVALLPPGTRVVTATRFFELLPRP